MCVGPRRGCPSRGTPNQLMDSNNRASKIDFQLIPTPEDAVRQYEEAGGRLTLFSEFGADPLANNAALIHQREVIFHQTYSTFDPLFHKLVNGDDTEFCSALHHFMDITASLHPN